MEATCIITEIRKQLRKDTKMGGVTGFSLLSAEKGRIQSKKRGHVEKAGYKAEPNIYTRKRIRF